MPLFDKPKCAVISKEVYVRVSFVSLKGRGQAGTFNMRHVLLQLEVKCVLPSTAGNSLKDIQPL